MTVENIWTDELVCPHCDHIIQDPMELLSDNDANVKGIQCENCAELFDAYLHIEYCFSTAKTKL